MPLDEKETTRVLEGMPTLVAVSFKRMLEATDPYSRFEAAIAVFENGFRLLTLIVISQYLILDGWLTHGKELRKRIDNSLRGTGLKNRLQIFREISAFYETRPHYLFVLELHSLYWDLSDPESLLVRMDFVNEVEQLIRRTTDFRDPKHWPADVIGWSQWLTEITPLVESFLRRILFLSDYELIRIVEVNGHRHSAELHKGLAITPISFDSEQEPPLRRDVYYLTKDRLQFFEFEPLLIPWAEEKERDTAILHRVLHNQLRYLLAFLNQRRWDTDRFYVYQRLMDPPKQDDQSDGAEGVIAWSVLAAIARDISAARMKRVKDTFEQRAEVYLEPRDLRDHFHTFMASDTRCFLLTGRSGVGKSSFVWSLTNEWTADPGLAYLMFDAPQLPPDVKLTPFVAERFADEEVWAREPADNIWRKIRDARGNDPNRRLILVLDGINEHPEALRLLIEVNDLLHGTPGWLKIVLTSRPEAWNRIRYRVAHLPSSFFFHPPANVESSSRPDLSAYHLDGFHPEEVREAYEHHQRYCDLKTPYDKLSSSVLSLIRDPLQLWMIACTHRGKPVPTRLILEELVEQYVDALIESRVLRSEDIDLLEKQLVPLIALEKGNYSNAITSDALEKAEGSLADRIFNDDVYTTGERVDASFKNLADAGIIVIHGPRAERAVEFRLERFYDHYVGKRLYEQSVERLQSPVEFCQELVGEFYTFPFLWGPTKEVVRRTLEETDAVVLQLALTSESHVAHLAREALKEYAPSDHSRVVQIVHDMVRLSITRVRKDDLSAQYAADTALEVARELGEKEPFLEVLECPNAHLRDIGIKQTYYLGADNPQLVLEILEELSEKVTSPRIIPNLPALRTATQLALLIAVDYWQKGQQSIQCDDAEGSQEAKNTTRQLVELASLSQQTIGRITEKTLFRVFRGLAQRRLAGMAVGVFMDLFRRNADTRSRNNPDLFARFFSRTEDVRDRARQALPYIDHTYGSLAEIVGLLADLYQSYDHLSEQIADSIIMVHGIHAPAEAEAVIWELLERVEDPGQGIDVAAASCWYEITARQQTIPVDALQMMKKLVSRWLDSSKHGYGVVERWGKYYQYRPLYYYMNLWARVHPHEPVDLLGRYVQQAEDKEDLNLLLHVIDTFKDPHKFTFSCRAMLRVLLPYVRSGGVVLDHLVDALGALRVSHPEDVDYFLFEADASRDLVNRIHGHSYETLSHELYARLAWLMLDFLAYSPREVVQNIIGILDKATYAGSLDKAAMVIANCFFDMLIEQGKGVVAR